MKYENIKEFKVTTKASKSKIYRFYKKNEELWSETMLKGGKRLFPVDHARCDLDFPADEKCRHGLQVRAIEEWRKVKRRLCSGIVLMLIVGTDCKSALSGK